MIITHNKWKTSIIACISHTDNLNKGQVIEDINCLLDDFCFNQFAKLYTILKTNKRFPKIMEIFL